MTAADLVTAQFDAYNRRDVKGNMDLFSDEFQIIQFPDNHVLIDGKHAAENMYRNLFDHSPALKADIIKRIDYGNRIFVHEVIYGRNGQQEPVEQMFLFEIVNDKIDKIYRF